MNFESNRRLVAHAINESSPPPWEGVTWILDLLPHWPGEALASLAAYQLAHAQQLPDGRYNGLSDAMAVIRAKWIGGSRPGKKLAMIVALSPRDFEHLIESIYDAMGYVTELTPRGRDGGHDVVARRNAGPSRRETLLIECKRYNRPVGVETVRTFHGVVYENHVNKGVLVTSSTFTRGARDKAAQYPRLELVAGVELVALCDEYLGASFDLRIDSILNGSKRRASAPSTSALSM